jgi:hypothetical protein
MPEGRKLSISSVDPEYRLSISSVDPEYHPEYRPRVKTGSARICPLEWERTQASAGRLSDAHEKSSAFALGMPGIANRAVYEA